MSDSRNHLYALLTEGQRLLDRQSTPEELKSWWWNLCRAIRALIASLREELETLRD